MPRPPRPVAPHARRGALAPALVGCVVALTLVSCSSEPTAASPASTPTSPPVPAPTVAAPTTPAPSLAPATPPAGPAPNPGASADTPTDLTQAAAGEFAAPSVAAATPGAGPVVAPAPGVDYADPLAVAKAYVTTRLTYRFDDPAGYTAALTAPALTTPGFAARSRPSASALARLATAQETSTAQVGGAELEGEAPNSASTRYVVVAAAVTTAYRGGGATAPAEWTLRLLQAPPGQWRVDGVLSTD